MAKKKVLKKKMTSKPKPQPQPVTVRELKKTSKATPIKGELKKKVKATPIKKKK